MPPDGAPPLSSSLPLVLPLSDGKATRLPSCFFHFRLSFAFLPSFDRFLLSLLLCCDWR